MMITTPEKERTYYPNVGKIGLKVRYRDYTGNQQSLIIRSGFMVLDHTVPPINGMPMTKSYYDRYNLYIDSDGTILFIDRNSSGHNVHIYIHKATCVEEAVDWLRKQDFDGALMPSAAYPSMLRMTSGRTVDSGDDC
jgi:hypothetical protein